MDAAASYLYGSVLLHRLYTGTGLCFTVLDPGSKKDPSTLKDYKKICKLGGSLPFRKIVQAANLKSPFEEGCLNETMKEVQNALNAITDENYNEKNKAGTIKRRNIRDLKRNTSGVLALCGMESKTICGAIKLCLCQPKALFSCGFGRV